MQSEVWQEIPDFDGADVEQKWIEGNPDTTSESYIGLQQMKIVNGLELS